MFSLFFRRLARMLSLCGATRDETYLAASADLGQLENRMRALARTRET